MFLQAQSSERSPSSRVGCSWVPSDRVQQLAAEHNRAVPAVGAERAIHYTDFYKNEAQRYSTAAELNAHSLAYHLRHRAS
jgi:ribosome biogenesis protein Tsr3